MCYKNDKAAYEGLSEGRVFNTMSELNINQFFTAAVHTVGKLDPDPFESENCIQ